MRDGHMRSMNSLLGDFLRQFQKDVEKTDLFLRELWPDIVGSQLAAHTRPLRLRGGVLKIAVSPEWKGELQAMEDSFRKTINRFWGAALVRSVQFVVRPGGMHKPGDSGSDQD